MSMLTHEYGIHELKTSATTVDQTTLDQNNT